MSIRYRFSIFHTNTLLYENATLEYHGEVAERFNVPPWKGGVRESVPGVQISPSPH